MLEEPGNEPTTDAPRTNIWLEARAALIQQVHFSDVAQGYLIQVYFSTRAHYRFGSICARNGRTHITVNQLFADLRVPAYVVDGTLAHELAHYAHGFGSGLPRLYAHAHRGGIVDKELDKRGLAEVRQKADAWRAEHWETFYASQCGDLVSRKTSRADTVHQEWEGRLCRPGMRTEAILYLRLIRLGALLGYEKETLPFAIEWLRATRRQMGLSYWYSQTGHLRLHGLLADPRVPEEVLTFELAYWLARQRVGGNWKAIHQLLENAGLADTAEKALRWRRHAWTAFCNGNHPLG